MSALVTCSACQMGDHEHHDPNPVKPPPGVLGGAVCNCPGGCTSSPEVDLLLAIFADAAPVEVNRGE